MPERDTLFKSTGFFFSYANFPGSPFAFFLVQLITQLNVSLMCDKKGCERVNSCEQDAGDC